MSAVHAVALPEYVQIEPVGQCNLRCRMCAVGFRKDAPTRGPAFMDFALFTRIVDEMNRMTALHLQGLGEPMMHPRFFDMVAYAAAKGVHVTTNTNLTLLTQRRAERCVESGLAELHVSLDGATAATYEAIRVRARYARVVANLERLIAARRAFGSPRPKVVIVFVAMRENLRELPELVEQAAAWGVEEVFVQHLCHDFGERTLPSEYAPMREFVARQSLLGVEPARVERQLDAARAKAAATGVKLRLPRVTAKARPGCDWPWRGAYVSHQGLAMPCCMIGTPDRMSLGDIAASGTDAVWNGPAYRAFRARLVSDDPPDICRSCSLYHGTF
ncbi:MAG TPA: radical SAM protein [Gammaproteobacteria bacterium]